MKIIQKNLEAYGNIVNKYQLYMMMGILLILMELMLLIHLVLKQKITGQTAANNNNNGNIPGRVNIELMVPLKYLNNFWRTLEMPLINCKIELILDWSANCVIIYTNVANQVPTFTITETNLYVPVVTLSTQDNYYYHS